MDGEIIQRLKTLAEEVSLFPGTQMLALNSLYLQFQGIGSPILILVSVVCKWHTYILAGNRLVHIG